MEQETARQLYQTAIENFERGNYGIASRQLEQALAMVNPQTKLGGEIQIWLVNAYEASGKIATGDRPLSAINQTC
jgi:outer membrane protein assembly factor BamD (BamD/ComL family)